MKKYQDGLRSLRFSVLLLKLLNTNRLGGCGASLSKNRIRSDSVGSAKSFLGVFHCIGCNF